MGFCITLTPRLHYCVFLLICITFAIVSPIVYTTPVFSRLKTETITPILKKSGTDPSNCENYRPTDLVKVDFVPISKTSVSSLLSFRKLSESQSFISAKQLVKKEKKNKRGWKTGRAGCRRHSSENRWHIF